MTPATVAIVAVIAILMFLAIRRMMRKGLCDCGEKSGGCDCSKACGKCDGCKDACPASRSMAEKLERL